MLVSERMNRTRGTGIVVRGAQWKALCDLDITSAPGGGTRMPAPIRAFRVEATVSNLDDRSRSFTLLLLVDTGSTYTTLPWEVVDILGITPIGTRRIRLPSGHVEERRAAAIVLKLGDQEIPTICLIGPVGDLARLGAVTLEELALGIDPIGQRLVPIESYRMATALA